MNLNNKVKIKLTDRGSKIYNKEYPRQLPVKEGDILTMTLSEVIGTFGMYTHFVCQEPFEWLIEEVEDI